MDDRLDPELRPDQAETGRVTGWWRRLRGVLDGPAFARFLETFAYADGELVPGDAPPDRNR